MRSSQTYFQLISQRKSSLFLFLRSLTCCAVKSSQAISHVRMLLWSNVLETETETVSRTLDHSSILTQLITREDFTLSSHCENLHLTSDLLYFPWSPFLWLALTEIQFLSSSQNSINCIALSLIFILRTSLLVAWVAPFSNTRFSLVLASAPYLSNVVIWQVHHLLSVLS